MKQRKLNGVIMALCLISSSACSGQVRQTVSAEQVLRALDSVGAASLLRADPEIISLESLRQLIRSELDITVRAPGRSLLREHVARLIVNAALVIRITERMAQQPLPDTVIRRGDTIVPIFPDPDPGDTYWIIRDSKAATHLIGIQDDGRSISDTVLPCSIDPSGFASGIPENYYAYAMSPLWTSVVSIWTPNSVKHVLVNGLRSISFSDYASRFKTPAPQPLHRLAQILVSQNCGD
jgi:hypothetical protein